MSNKNKVVEQDNSQYGDQEVRDSLIAEIPKNLVEKAANTGLGYKFRLVRVRNKGNGKGRSTWTAKRLFLKKGDKIHYKKDDSIVLKVVSEYDVELTNENGGKMVLSFPKAHKECDYLSTGAIGGTTDSIWQNKFIVKSKEHGSETLIQRRERIIEEKLADLQ